MVPLLLQPIVENAIIHGLETRDHSGTIWISIYHIDEVVFIDISDNGYGIQGEELKELLTKVQDYTKKRRRSNIGLYNINRRLKLNYGEQYGLEVLSTYGEGTMVRVTFPIMQIEKENTES